jgi:ABC-2 type transport system ATP-binding protein
MKFAIDARGLGKIYKGNVAALAGVDLEVKAGDIFALLGPNGAGKTTMLKQ